MNSPYFECLRLTIKEGNVLGVRGTACEGNSEGMQQRFRLRP